MPGADQASRFRGFGRGQYDEIGLGKRLVQARRRENALRQVRIGVARARHCPDLHPQRLHATRQFAPDGAKADDQERLPGQLTRTLRHIPDLLLGPAALQLIAHRSGKMPRQRDECAQDVLGHGNGVDAAGVGHHHI